VTEQVIARHLAARVLGREPALDESRKLDAYVGLLLRWQRVHRLVGSSDPDWIMRRLVLDSLLFLRVLPPDAEKVLDLGSGAGLPGIPLAIAAPRLAMTLMEGRQRRASFLAEAARVLDLSNCRVVRGRAEDAVGEMEGQFDAVVMRCAGSSWSIVGLAQRFVREGGVVVLSGPPEGVAEAVADATWTFVDGVDPGERRSFRIVTARQ
jgi:16S rRNA (guanine527-N7)-methyltransferase